MVNEIHAGVITVPFPDINTLRIPQRMPTTKDLISEYSWKNPNLSATQYNLEQQKEFLDKNIVQPFVAIERLKAGSLQKVVDNRIVNRAIEVTKGTQEYKNIATAGKGMNEGYKNLQFDIQVAKNAPNILIGVDPFAPPIVITKPNTNLDNYYSVNIELGRISDINKKYKEDYEKGVTETTIKELEGRGLIKTSEEINKETQARADDFVKFVQENTNKEIERKIANGELKSQADVDSYIAKINKNTIEPGIKTISDSATKEYIKDFDEAYNEYTNEKGKDVFANVYQREEFFKPVTTVGNKEIMVIKDWKTWNRSIAESPLTTGTINFLLPKTSKQVIERATLTGLAVGIGLPFAAKVVGGTEQALGLVGKGVRTGLDVYYISEGIKNLGKPQMVPERFLSTGFAVGGAIDVWSTAVKPGYRYAQSLVAPNKVTTPEVTEFFKPTFKKGKQVGWEISNEKTIVNKKVTGGADDILLPKTFGGVNTVSGTPYAYQETYIGKTQTVTHGAGSGIPWVEVPLKSGRSVWITPIRTAKELKNMGFKPRGVIGKGGIYVLPETSSASDVVVKGLGEFYGTPLSVQKLSQPQAIRSILTPSANEPAGYSFGFTSGKTPELLIFKNQPIVKRGVGGLFGMGRKSSELELYAEVRKPNEVFLLTTTKPGSTGGMIGMDYFKISRNVELINEDMLSKYILTQATPKFLRTYTTANVNTAKIVYGSSVSITKKVGQADRLINFEKLPKGSDEWQSSKAVPYEFKSYPLLYKPSSSSSSLSYKSNVNISSGSLFGTYTKPSGSGGSGGSSGRSGGSYIPSSFVSPSPSVPISVPISSPSYSPVSRPISKPNYSSYYIKPNYTYNPKPTPGSLSLISKSSGKKGSLGYVTLVKKRGKFVKLPGISPYGKALKKGVAYTTKTVAASFKVEATKVKVTEPDIGFKVPVQIFRRSKKLKDVFVQRGGPEPSYVRGARLASQTEKKQLQSLRPRKVVKFI